MEVRTVNINSRNSGCFWSLFSKGISIIRIFCISGSFFVQRNKGKCSSTVFYLQQKYLYLPCEFTVKPQLIWSYKWRFSYNISRSYIHETIRFLPLPFWTASDGDGDNDNKIWSWQRTLTHQCGRSIIFTAIGIAGTICRFNWSTKIFQFYNQ
jgi:hypothetical protein